MEDDDIEPEVRALRNIFLVNERAMFELVVAPLTIGELAAIRDTYTRVSHLRWALEVLEHWHITLSEIGDDSVRQQRSLSPELVALEDDLLKIPDLRRSPYDRLILLETRMAGCSALITLDSRTILRHREVLEKLGISVLLPSEFWEALRPWAALWR